MHIHYVIRHVNAAGYEYQIRSTINLNTHLRTALPRWNVHRPDQSIPRISLPQARQRIFHGGGDLTKAALLSDFGGLKHIRLFFSYDNAFIKLGFCRYYGFVTQFYSFHHGFFWKLFSIFNRIRNNGLI